MRREPLLPKGGDQGAQSAYRKALHEDLYPSNTAWTPTVGGVSSASVTGSFVRMGRFYSVCLVLEAPVTITPGGYFDLPFTVAQGSVFGVAVGSDNKAAVVDAGSNRVYLPSIGPVARVVVSGVVVA